MKIYRVVLQTKRENWLKKQKNFSHSLLDYTYSNHLISVPCHVNTSKYEVSKLTRWFEIQATNQHMIHYSSHCSHDIIHLVRDSIKTLNSHLFLSFSSYSRNQVVFQKASSYDADKYRRKFIIIPSTQLWI